MTTATPPIGTILNLATALVRVKLTAEKTMPDTPDLYGAGFDVLTGGDLDLSQLKGKTGPEGAVVFPLRPQDDNTVNTIDDLPKDLTNTQADVGKYWLLDTLDDDGNVIWQSAWVWYGTDYREISMGVQGPPGAVPDIDLNVHTIDPATGSSYMTTDGPTLTPQWDMYLAQPRGPVGDPRNLMQFPDFDGSAASPDSGDLLIMANGEYNLAGEPLFEARSILSLDPQPRSVPQSAFNTYSGVSQQAAIGSFELPDQEFDWTPIVWGHLGGTAVTDTGHTNTIQHLTITATSGTFTLARLFAGIGATSALAYDIDAADLQTAIQGLSGIGSGNVTVTATGDYNFDIEFVGSLTGTGVNQLVVDDSGLVPAGTASAKVTVTQSGQTSYGLSIGLTLSSNPLMIGAQVLIGDPKTGTQIARGLGNTLGEVNIMPHYSTSKLKAQAITPTNNYAKIPANTSDPAARTIYFNLYNDGKLGAYAFDPHNAQVFVMVMPLELFKNAATTHATRRVR
ncbi:hypothetical protein [Mycolicibacterium sphagni]|uniref:hypothetical protein n=1 Tax=Mycolicibacterium sphagni TaxID=1786 RepID=UPI0021F29472|nr:hypothetical protein [Mycolicibacterium sphagni]MCV7174943.1 hypothetical protein [Mycolicibacterium sphagni]